MKDPADNLTGELNLSEEAVVKMTEGEAHDALNQMWRSIVALTMVCLAASEVLERKGYDMDSPEFLDVMTDKFHSNKHVCGEARAAMAGVAAAMTEHGGKNVLARLGFLHQRSMNA